MVAHPSPPAPWLVADIGGTNARFGWVEAPGSEVEQVMALPADDHPGPVAAAHAYLSELKSRLGPRYKTPRAAAFAVATAVDGDTVTFTNSRWHFSRAAARTELGLDTLLMLNDFEALALSLPDLPASHLRPIGTGASAPADGARAVIGPGTGLGVATLIACRPGHWHALPGEGGHATLAPADALESEILAAARREFPHVSAERLLSGIGLPVLHRALAAATGRSAAALDAPEIVERGVAGTDMLAAETLEHFCALLGGFAGNVALTVGARSGVYIGGGIVPRLGERFFSSRFRERFEAKGRFDGYLRAIPTWLITDTLVALTGARAALSRPPG